MSDTVRGVHGHGTRPLRQGLGGSGLELLFVFREPLTRHLGNWFCRNSVYSFSLSSQRLASCIHLGARPLSGRNSVPFLVDAYLAAHAYLGVEPPSDGSTDASIDLLYVHIHGAA
jgi:hypothetical protein